MFSKVFKYDFKYVFRFWWIFALTTAVLSCGGGMLIRGLIENQDVDNFLFEFLSAMGLISVFILICLFPFAAVIISLVRYYRNFFSDEGYLTFTLPVKRTALLNSKILSFFLLELMTLLVLIADVYLILAIGIKDLHQVILKNLPVFLDYLKELWSGYLTLDVILVPVLLIVACLMSINIYYLCITIGSIVARKHRVMASIGIYFGVSALLNLIQQIISYFTIESFFYTTLYSSDLRTVSQSLALFLLLDTVLYAGIAVAAYFVNLYCIKNKLNMA